MITGKQRAVLRAAANKIPSILQIGKGGINDNLVKQIDDALEARELVKIHILDTSFLDTKDTANTLAKRLGAEPVSSIGSRFVLYRESEKNKTIEI